jgi:hypothetical protein
VASQTLTILGRKAAIPNFYPKHAYEDTLCIRGKTRFIIPILKAGAGQFLLQLAGQFLMQFNTIVNYFAWIVKSNCDHNYHLLINFIA